MVGNSHDGTATPKRWLHTSTEHANVFVVLLNAHTGNRALLTSMGGLYDATTLCVLLRIQDCCFRKFKKVVNIIKSKVVFLASIDARIHR